MALSEVHFIFFKIKIMISFKHLQECILQDVPECEVNTRNLLSSCFVSLHNSTCQLSRRHSRGIGEFCDQQISIV